MQTVDSELKPRAILHLIDKQVVLFARLVMRLDIVIQMMVNKKPYLVN